MKRLDLIRHLESHGCEFLREGGNHTIYVNRPGEKSFRRSAPPRNHRVHRAKNLQGFGNPAPVNLSLGGTACRRPKTKIRVADTATIRVQSSAEFFRCASCADKRGKLNALCHFLLDMEIFRV
jgi:mRNA interferase HicA